MLIIDIHFHSRKSEISECIKYAKKLQISKICNLGSVYQYGLGNPTKKQIESINNATIRSVRRYSGFMVGFCFLNPRHDKEFIRKEIVRCLSDKLQGIKLEHCLNCRDKKLDVIMKIAEEMKLPVLQHCFYDVLKQVPDESDPSDVANLASRFPKVNIIMPHLAGCGIRGVQDVRPYPNVYVDTSGMQPVNGLVEYAVKELGAKRVLYGSDVYYPSGRDFAAQLGRVLGARIKESEKELILGLNAKKILGVI